MANRATQSLTTGMKILGGANVPTYTLEHLTSSGGHKQGSYDTIVVPYIELGRSSNCAVRFSDDLATVSRKHAAIERKGDETYIVNLSSSNPTLVNGRPVEDRYFLNNGDEIQLSVEGPRMRYNTTKTGTAKMGFTNRMNLVMKQAIKPYKTAAISFLLVFVFAVLGATAAIIYLKKENENLTAELDKLEKLTESEVDAIKLKNDSLQQALMADKEEFQKKLSSYQSELAKSQRKMDELEKSSSGSYDKYIEELNESVLALYLTRMSGEMNGSVIFDEVLDETCMCTGYLLEDGRFVTARHCVDLVGGADLQDLQDGEVNVQQNALNFIATSGGKITYHFKAYSPNGGTVIEFTNHDVTYDTGEDDVYRVTYNGQDGAVRVANYFNGSDWAYMKTSKKGAIKPAPQLSSQLKSGRELFCLGYSYGTQFRGGKTHGFKPYFTKANVSVDGLPDNYITVSQYGFDGGNSGGPFFTIENGEPVAVGIVTGKYMYVNKVGLWEETEVGVITPLANIP